MQKLTFLHFSSILLLAAKTQAQTNGKITGKVIDKNSKPLQLVTVSLLQIKDSSLVKAGITVADGSFEITPNMAGNFIVSFTIVDFENKFSDTFSLKKGESYKVKTIVMERSTHKLTGVTVVSKKPLIEIKADKTVFNVEASINATGSNALELLQKSPGVQVDNNDNISMKGKTGVKIYVDGKMMQLDTKDLAAFLKSINSNDIEAIEMISNPSAKYDASGNAGIINLRLKKNKKFGTNGSANVGLVQGITPKGNGSVAINYRDKKVNLFSNISAQIGRYQNRMALYRVQKDSIYDQNTLNHSNEKSTNLKVGGDYFINDKNTIGIMATTNFGDNRWLSEGGTPIYYQPTGKFIKKLESSNNVPGSRTNANFNINYRYADTSGTEVNFDGDYGLFNGTRRSYQPNNYYNNANTLLYSIINSNYTPTDIDIKTAKIDVEQKLGKGKMGYGAKTSFVTTKNTFDFFNNDSTGLPIKVMSQSSKFKYKENVNAAYVNYQQQLNVKWSLQVGLRAEQTNSEGILSREDGIIQPDNRVKRSYLDFFPSGAVTWSLHKNHTLNLTFSRRIDRPTYQDLNPFENKLDELTYIKGNAFLRPQYTNNVELTHTFMGILNTSVNYSHVKDYATIVTDTVKNATYIQQQNLATQDIFGANIGSSTPINKWWSGYANIWFSYQKFNGVTGGKHLKVSIPLYGAYLQQAFILGKDYTAELSGWFNGPSIWGATWRNKSQGGLDLGLQKLFLQKKITAKIQATDILRTASPWRAISNFGGVYIKAQGSWESQTFRLTLSYRFGSNSIKSSRDRKTGLDSESKRIK